MMISMVTRIAPDTPLMMTSLGSASKNLRLIAASPLIRAELSNEAVSTFVTLTFVWVL